MQTYNGVLDGSHVGGTIRLALRAHGFTVSKTDVDRVIEERNQIGSWLRDEALPQRFPLFASVADYHTIAKMNPALWDRLPQMMGFGYQQAVVLHDLTVQSPVVDTSVATLGAAFSAGIALVDYLVDTQTNQVPVFEVLNHDVVRGMFDPTTNTVEILARAYKRVEDPRLRLLCALVAICATGFWELYRHNRNERAWASLAETIIRMYEAERTVSLVKPASRSALRNLLPAIEAKSVLPFVAMHHIVALSSSQPKAPVCVELASTTLGHVVWLTDDLVDLVDDCHRGTPSVVFLRLADLLAEQGRDWPSDADVYKVVDLTVTEILGLLRPSAFGLNSAGTAAGSENCRADSGEAEKESLDAGLVALLDYARLTVASWVRWQDESVEGHLLVGSGRDTQRTQDNPAHAATKMLLAQQRDGYREAIHHLLLPRLSPEGMHLETHPALLFQRAIVLDGLLDAYEASHLVPRSVLDAEASMILRAKHPFVRGGWNYIPEVLELPPDADDLGMMLQVLYRVGGPALASACDEAIRLALAAAGPDGGFSTWILDPNGRSVLDETMRTYIEVTDSAGVHPDVVSNLLYALHLYDPERYEDALLRSAAYLETVQDERGAWPSRWYAGPYYGTYRVVSALSVITSSNGALERARSFLLHSQRSDGSWGEGWSDPLATALAILTLTVLGTGLGDKAIERGVTHLVSTQEADGGWAASPFISFPNSDGSAMHTYASRTITTTFCLKALLATVDRVVSLQSQ